MQRIHIVACGKIKEKYYQDAIAEYEKRLSRFCKTDVTEFDEIVSDNGLEKESTLILSKLSGYVICCDKGGTLLTSENFAKKLNSVANIASDVTFVIGSSNGLSSVVKNKADFSMSFGAITLPHSLARVVLFEQLYRAYTILNNGAYHK